MTYLLAQLWLLLLLAGLIGSVVGWVLRGGCKRQVRALKDLQDKYQLSEKENYLNKENQGRVTRLQREKKAMLAEIKSLKNNGQLDKKWSAQLLSLKKTIIKFRKLHQQTSQKLKKAEELLTFARQAGLAKDAKIKQLKEECSATESLMMTCETDWETKQQELQTELGDLQKTFQVINIKQEETESRLKEKESTVAKLIAQFSEKEQEIEAAEQQKNNVVGQLDSFKEQAEGFIKAVTDENRSYRDVVDRLENDINQREKKLEERENEIEKVHAELKDKEKVISKLNDRIDVETRSVSQSSTRLTVNNNRNVSFDALSKKKTTGNSKSRGVSRWKRIKSFNKRRRT